MGRSAILITATLLCGCGAYQPPMSVEQQWRAAGHPMPDLACHAYLDVSQRPDILVYLYFRPPNSGRVLLPTEEIISATYELAGTTRHWRWGRDPRNGNYAYDIMVTNNGHGYYYDFTVYSADQETIAKSEDYMCIAMR